MKYIEGLYAYWDRIAEAWPDSLREECASGGRRIDLETIQRMHLHQKSDHWFDNMADQASLWGLSQYLPNNIIDLPINRLDTTTFHSMMASSMVLGWIADAPDFDTHRAKEHLRIYQKYSHLLVGAWYPLLPQTRDPNKWNASQYHRPDLDEGMLLVFRGEKSPYPGAEVKLHGLDPDVSYQFESRCGFEYPSAMGSQLMSGLSLHLSGRESSDLIQYEKMK
jgi:alpha-galactosidase